MSRMLFSMRGYAHLYKSLLLFRDISSFEAKELCYYLNLSNIDTYMARFKGLTAHEHSVHHFARRMYGPERPYRTQVQLYKSMEALEHGISTSMIPDRQKQAVSRLRALMRDTEAEFLQTYGMDIADPRTVYMHCAADLIPRRGEPDTCLIKDWNPPPPGFCLPRDAA